MLSQSISNHLRLSSTQWRVAPTLLGEQKSTASTLRPGDPVEVMVPRPWRTLLQPMSLSDNYCIGDLIKECVTMYVLFILM